MNQGISIGIITGAGPEAGMDLWKRILDKVRFKLGDAYQGDVQAPQMLIHSAPKLGLCMNLSRHEEDVWNELKRSLEAMSSKVDIVCIACNMLHIYEERIAELGLDFDLISIVDVLYDHLCRTHVTELALLSIPDVMDIQGKSPYKKIAVNFKVVVPKNAKPLLDIIKTIKREGMANDNVTLQFSNIVNSLGVKNIALACTELSLISIKENKYYQYFDTSDLLAESISNEYVESL